MFTLANAKCNHISSPRLKHFQATNYRKNIRECYFRKYFFQMFVIILKTYIRVKSSSTCRWCLYHWTATQHLPPTRLPWRSWILNGKLVSYCIKFVSRYLVKTFWILKSQHYIWVCQHTLRRPGNRGVSIVTCHYCILVEIRREWCDLIGWEAVRTGAYRLAYGPANGLVWYAPSNL